MVSFRLIREEVLLLRFAEKLAMVDELEEVQTEVLLFFL